MQSFTASMPLLTATSTFRLGTEKTLEFSSTVLSTLYKVPTLCMDTCLDLELHSSVASSTTACCAPGQTSVTDVASVVLSNVSQIDSELSHSTICWEFFHGSL